MEKIIKLFAIALTIILIAMVYYGIVRALFLSFTFWLFYVFTLLIDMLLIAYLKKIRK